VRTYHLYQQAMKNRGILDVRSIMGHYTWR